MRILGKEYRTIWYKNNVVKIIDQTKLPHQFIVKNLKTVKDAINAIKVMEVRGAPLIGGTAAYGIALAVQENTDSEFIKKSAEELIESRPTAINLKWAVDHMMKKLQGINSDQILDIKKWSISPTIFNNNLRQPGNQLLESDIIYIKDPFKLDVLSDTQLKKFILISHYLFKSVDLAVYLILELERRDVLTKGAFKNYITNFKKYS